MSNARICNGIIPDLCNDIQVAVLNPRVAFLVETRPMMRALARRAFWLRGKARYFTKESDRGSVVSIG